MRNEERRIRFSTRQKAARFATEGGEVCWKAKAMLNTAEEFTVLSLFEGGAKNRPLAEEILRSEVFSTVAGVVFRLLTTVLTWHVISTL